MLYIYIISSSGAGVVEGLRGQNGALELRATRENVSWGSTRKVLNSIKGKGVRVYSLLSCLVGA